MSETDYVRIGTGPYSIDGPDLAFPRLPKSLVGTLKARVSVVNGDKQYKDTLSGEPASRERVEFVAGVIAEWTNPPIQEGNTVRVIFSALSNAGKIIEKKTLSGLEMMRFRPISAPDFNLPTTYGGTSGGGVWRLFVAKSDDGPYSMTQRRLIGVAYWQDPVGAEMHIICHGPDSIYGALREKIRAKWPSAA